MNPRVEIPDCSLTMSHRIAANLLKDLEQYLNFKMPDRVLVSVQIFREGDYTFIDCLTAEKEMPVIFPII